MLSYRRSSALIRLTVSLNMLLNDCDTFSTLHTVWPMQAGITVGLPVTRQPPHSGLSRRSCPFRLWSSYDPWPLYAEEIYHLLKASPVVVATLTASVEPLEEDVQSLFEKLHQAGIVAQLILAHRAISRTLYCLGTFTSSTTATLDTLVRSNSPAAPPHHPQSAKEPSIQRTPKTQSRAVGG